MNIKLILKTNKYTSSLYSHLKSIKDDCKEHKRRAWERTKFKFVDRSSGKTKVCVLLAGYKTFLYENTFERIRRFLPMDTDMVVVTSGMSNTI